MTRPGSSGTSRGASDPSGGPRRGRVGTIRPRSSTGRSARMRRRREASEVGLKSRRMERFPLLLREEGVILPPELTIQDQNWDGGCPGIWV